MLSPEGVAQSEGQGQSPYPRAPRPHHITMYIRAGAHYILLCTFIRHYLDAGRTAHYNIYLDGPIATGKQRAVALASEAQGAAVAA